MKIIAILFCTFNLTTTAFAQSRPQRATKAEKPLLTYDLGASSGSYNGTSYSELNLGLNFNFTEFLTWRNSAFKRFGSGTTDVSGLDSTLRLNIDLKNENHQGLDLFIGPGVRIATNKNSAMVAEAGLQLSLGGLKVGGGAKYLKYFETAKDASNNSLPGDETQYFITLSGGGAL